MMRWLIVIIALLTTPAAAQVVCRPGMPCYQGYTAPLVPVAPAKSTEWWSAAPRVSPVAPRQSSRVPATSRPQPAAGCPSACQEQIDALRAKVEAQRKRIDDLETTVGDLVSVAPPIPEHSTVAIPDTPPVSDPPDGGIQSQIDRLAAELDNLVERVGVLAKRLEAHLACGAASGQPVGSDLDGLARKIIGRLPPIVLQSAERPEDGGREYWRAEVRPGDTVRLPGIEVHHIDKSSDTPKQVERVHLADVLTIYETPVKIPRGGNAPDSTDERGAR